MRIYTNDQTSKHYISYSAAVLSMVEAGFTLVSNVDAAQNEKAVFSRPTGGMFGAPPVEYGFISYMDTEDEIAAQSPTDAQILDMVEGKAVSL